jgi:hypothetical protein
VPCITLADMRKLSRFLLAPALVAAVAIGAIAGTALAAPRATTAASPYPPCSKPALTAGSTRGPAAVGHARFTKPFGCVRRWAYSGGLVGHGQNEVEVTILYHAVNGRWQTSNRAGPCRARAVPKKIYQPACESN